MFKFKDEIAVNNFICVTLRDKGIPTNTCNRLHELELQSYTYKCFMFKKVLAYYRGL